jgi:hypothetical protein
MLHTCEPGPCSCHMHKTLVPCQITGQTRSTCLGYQGRKVLTNTDPGGVIPWIQQLEKLDPQLRLWKDISVANRETYCAHHFAWLPVTLMPSVRTRTNLHPWAPRLDLLARLPSWSHLSANYSQRDLNGLNAVALTHVLPPFTIRRSLPTKCACTSATQMMACSLRTTASSQASSSSATV